VKDDLRFDAQDFAAEPAEVPVPARVSTAAKAMMRAVHFDNQPNG